MECTALDGVPCPRNTYRMSRIEFIHEEARALRKQARRATPISVPELTAGLEMIERAAELELGEQALAERQADAAARGEASASTISRAMPR